ncbi:hypothetical protein Pla175_21240 [Pirellulimonas nuda]|uniref:PEP-CTERM protein-sorting domain-containing protein n=1 Tax=Pirellulimonas nuda TaxID=2528009 RepID=A0A518DBB1_9BACT|nr:PEP-CTERM sorting domain-containing protein [Pirellulimonas nuda]QDU88742.1 hypothetical protein Pla175_21240 [Pirellulimonas nuda]
MQRQLRFLACFVTIAMVSASANAGMISTFISNFQVAFDGATGELTDFNRPNGGNLVPAEARTFSTLEIVVDGSTEVMKMNPPDALWADLKVTNLGSALPIGFHENVGGAGNPSAFGFDFFDASGNSLRIGIDDITYALISFPGFGSTFQFAAEGVVLSQSLPISMQYGPNVLVTYTASDVMVMQGAGGVTSLIASGSMTITGQMVPEPTSLVGGLLSLAGVVGFGLRKRLVA